MYFIENLIRILEEKNITAYKLCKDLELPKNTLNNWKSGSLPTIDKVEKIIIYLNIEPYELLNIPHNKNICTYTKDEKTLIEAYRAVSPEIKKVVKATLEVSKPTKSDMDELCISKTG